MKLKKSILLVLFVLIASSAFAVEHYAHMLSCGVTIYVNHAYVLSDEDVLKEIEELELEHCGVSTTIDHTDDSIYPIS